MWFILVALICEITPHFAVEDPEVPRVEGTCLQPHRQLVAKARFERRPQLPGPRYVSNLEAHQEVSVPGQLRRRLGLYGRTQVMQRQGAALKMTLCVSESWEREL